MGLNQNGKLVLGESIGDLGGLKIAWLAFQKSMQGKPRPADIDGFTRAALLPGLGAGLGEETNAGSDAATNSD